MNLKDYYLSMGLQKKIQAMFIFMMAVCILFCFCVFYLTLRNKMDTSATDNERNNRVAITKNLTSTLENVNSISRLTMTRDEVHRFLIAPDITTSVTTGATQSIHDITNTFNISCNITVFRNDGRYISTGPGITYVNAGNIYETDWLNEVRAQRGGYVIKSNKKVTAFSSNIGDVITFVRVINDTSSQREIGILAINLPSRFLMECYEGLADENNHFAIYDHNGTLVCGDKYLSMPSQVTPKSLLPGKNITKEFSHEKVSTITTLANNSFYLVSSSEAELVGSVSTEIVWLLLSGSLILVGLIAMINRYIQRNVTRPIKKLVDSMSAIQNGWFHRVSMNVHDDEIGQLKNSYNTMLIEINRLIEELIQKEKNLQRAEMQALQEQIKPHFLYNTLDMIRYMALEKKTDEVYDMLETLGNFYRKFLSKGSPDIPLGEEIEIIKNYLTLQKHRYKDVFDDEYEIEDGVSNIRVPRLILQPLVENSIYHGVRLKGEKCVIRLKVYRRDDTLYLSVYDNGVGMTPTQKRLLFEGKDTGSFGFKGTIERIRYYYRTDDVFELLSLEGKFCEVILKLPLKEDIGNVSSNDYR